MQSTAPLEKRTLYPSGCAQRRIGINTSNWENACASLQKASQLSLGPKIAVHELSNNAKILATILFIYDCLSNQNHTLQIRTHKKQILSWQSAQNPQSFGSYNPAPQAQKVERDLKTRKL